MELKQVYKKDVCRASLMRKITSWAKRSMYRMNANSADCYAFNLTNNGTDWDGGWDWSNDIIDKDADYILMLDNNKVYRIIK